MDIRVRGGGLWWWGWLSGIFGSAFLSCVKGDKDTIIWRNDQNMGVHAWVFMHAICDSENSQSPPISVVAKMKNISLDFKLLWYQI